MPRPRSDHDWETLGAKDPFWAVLTEDGYRMENLSPDSVGRFLETGEAHVARLWKALEAGRTEALRPRRALDFGCGTGRVALALAARCDEVVGADVAASMLRQARELAARRNVGNLRFLQCTDDLAELDGSFDLIHSYIVFQHIPTERGLKLVRRLFGLLDPKGHCVLHFLFSSPNALAHSAAMRPLRAIWLELRRRVARLPPMQMNPYPLAPIFETAHAAGARSGSFEFTTHGNRLGIVLRFSGPSAPEPFAQGSGG